MPQTERYRVFGNALIFCPKGLIFKDLWSNIDAKWRKVDVNTIKVVQSGG
jgi:hypothetical protein